MATSDRTFVGPDGFPQAYPLDACVGGYDGYGVACQDFSPITNNAAMTASAINYLADGFGTGMTWNPYASSTKAAPSVGLSSMTVIGGVVAVVALFALMGGRR